MYGFNLLFATSVELAFHIFDKRACYALMYRNHKAKLVYDDFWKMQIGGGEL